MYATIQDKQTALWRKAWTVVDVLDSGMLNIIGYGGFSGNPLYLFFTGDVIENTLLKMLKSSEEETDKIVDLSSSRDVSKMFDDAPFFAWPTFTQEEKKAMYNEVLEDRSEGPVYLFEFVDMTITAFVDAVNFDNKNFPIIDDGLPPYEKDRAPTWRYFDNYFNANYFGVRPLRKQCDDVAALWCSETLWCKALHLAIDHMDGNMLNALCCGANGGDTLTLFYSCDAVNKAMNALRDYMGYAKEDKAWQDAQDWLNLTQEQKVFVYNLLCKETEHFKFELIDETMTNFAEAFKYDEENTPQPTDRPEEFEEYDE
jgi:hypothetical protein